MISFGFFSNGYDSDATYTFTFLALQLFLGIRGSVWHSKQRKEFSETFETFRKYFVNIKTLLF
jgi:hypothetical protein